MWCGPPGGPSAWETTSPVVQPALVALCQSESRGYRRQPSQAQGQREILDAPWSADSNALRGFTQYPRCHTQAREKTDNPKIRAHGGSATTRKANFTYLRVGEGQEVMRRWTANPPGIQCAGEEHWARPGHYCTRSAHGVSAAPHALTSRRGGGAMRCATGSARKEGRRWTGPKDARQRAPKRPSPRLGALGARGRGTRGRDARHHHPPSPSPHRT